MPAKSPRKPKPPAQSEHRLESLESPKDQMPKSKKNGRKITLRADSVCAGFSPQREHIFPCSFIGANNQDKGPTRRMITRLNLMFPRRSP